MIRFKLDGRFRREAVGLINGQDFHVGVLSNKPHFSALNKSFGFKKFPTGIARKQSRTSYSTIAETSQGLRKRTRINFFTEPFKSKKNKDVLFLINNFLDFVLRKKGSEKRLENALQAVVRNPIMRGDYGRNTKQTADNKGFNKLFVDTGQLFRNITAKVRKKRVR